MKLIFFFVFRSILFPIMLLISFIIYVRNWLYDKNILKSVRPDIFTINVGNLNLGGTGKTPHVEYLVRLLADKYQVSILSRGYKRKTKGYILADETATAESIGDEPMQYYLKFKDKINVVVCEDRVKGITPPQPFDPSNRPMGREQTTPPPTPPRWGGEFLRTLPIGEGRATDASVGLFILDDAFQHRRIKPHLNLLLCDYNRPFYEDSLVPFGRLRDLRSSAKRADAVIVTKCPKDISYQKYKEIIAGMKTYVLPETPIFFSKIKYKTITGYSPKNTFKFMQDVNVVTGIANSDAFVEYILAEKIRICEIHGFADHFAFSREKIDKILSNSKADKVNQIITTEKDMVKIKPLLTEAELKMFFYIPIQIEIEDKKGFDAFVLGRIENLTK